MNKKTNQTEAKPNIYFLPVILFIGIIPMIVHMYQYDPKLSGFDWFPANLNLRNDFYFTWKMIALIVVGIGMGLILLFRRFCEEEQLRFDRSFYFLLVYAGFVILSALFSAHKYWVVHGTYELFEPVWVLGSYMIACYYTFNYVQEEKQVDTIFRFSGIGVAIITGIGVFQYLGMDFFQSSVGKYIICDRSWWKSLDRIASNFSKGTVYTTLYNPNFLSFYYGMLIPLLICLFIGTKNTWKRALIAVAEVLCLFCLKGSNSASGWMALVLGTVVFLLVLLSRRKSWFCIGSVVVVLGIAAALWMGNMTQAGRSVRDTIVGTYHMKDKIPLWDVQTGDAEVTLNIRGNDLMISYEVLEDGTTQISCRDAGNNEIPVTVTDEGNQVTALEDDRFTGIQVQPASFGEGFPGITVTIEGAGWNFLKYQDSGYYYLNPANRMVKYEPVRQAELFRDDAMSNRGNIWNHTLPLLGKHIILGAGANTYMLEYPQNDYLSQMYLYGQNSYEVKAHSWYLQQWVETGLIGTLALLGFCFLYLVHSIRIYRKADLHKRMSWIGLGIFWAVVVYMFAAIVNDSNVCTAPVFWGLLGLGLAVNRMVERQSAEVY